MGTLYIVGNGLDLHFKLKTETEDFEAILETKYIYNEIENAFEVLKCYGITDWSDYEETLTHIDLEAIESEHLTSPDYLSDHESDRDGTITNMSEFLESMSAAIMESLEDMVSRVDEETEERDPLKAQPFFCTPDDAILSFNYTSTIENWFDVPSDVFIWHIHGCLARKEPLTFGYGVPTNDYAVEFTEDGDFYLDEQRMAILRFYQGWKKKLKLDKLKSFLKEHCGTIDKICVYGHSLGMVDSAYMEQIEQILHPTEWDIWYHGSNDKALINAKEYSFFEKMHFFEW